MERELRKLIKVTLDKNNIEIPFPTNMINTNFQNEERMDKQMVENFNLGDIVEMKKTHPCGTNNFEIIRIGADIKIKCVGCGRIVMIPRRKFQKDAKKIVAVAES